MFNLIVVGDDREGSVEVLFSYVFRRRRSGMEVDIFVRNRGESNVL